MNIEYEKSRLREHCLPVEDPAQQLVDGGGVGDDGGCGAEAGRRHVAGGGHGVAGDPGHEQLAHLGRGNSDHVHPCSVIETRAKGHKYGKTQTKLTKIYHNAARRLFFPRLI